MAILPQGEPRRMYSWWWDSHISPRNSKWLHENLSDMDRNIKAMIKLIEEDADSFARRAEMFYKKRPELMQLMEEFYRSYRALAERYDHATGALHQAHQTMAEAFPNQIPPMVHDEPPFSSTSDIEPHTPEMPSPLQVRLDSDDLHCDAFGVSSHFTYSEENDLLSSNKRLKQSNHAKSYEGKVKEKVLNFEEVDRKVEDKVDPGNEIKRLQEKIYQLSTRNDNLMSQMALESLRALTLEEVIYKFESTEEATLLQYKFTLEKISGIGSDIANTRRELSKVNDEMVLMLTSVEEQCLAVANVNRTLQLELEAQQKELQERRIEFEELTTSIEKEKQKRMQAEVALMSLEQIHTHSQEEAELLALEIHGNIEKLEEMELGKVGLDEKINELNEIIGDLHEQNKSLDAKIRDLQDESKLLNQTKEKLEYELGIYLQENAALQKEVFCLKGDLKDFKHRHLGLAEHMEVVLEKNVMLEKFLSDANVELEGLREKVNALEASCETLLGEVSTNVVEKGILASKIETISLNMERLSEKNTLLENSLSDANVELEGLRARFKHLQGCCLSLCDQNSSLLAEKSTLISQVEDIRQSLEILEKKYSELEPKNLNLEIEKDAALHQVLELEKSWKLEKQKHLALETQLYILQEEKQAKLDEFDIEQEKYMNALIDIFILQRCLCDMKGQNLILYREWQKLLVASKHSGKKIAELEHELVIRQNESMLISEKSEKLRNGILQLLKELNINKECNTTDSIDDEALIQTIQNSIANTQEESQCFHLEIVVLVALLEHVGLEKVHLCHELEILTEELLSLRNKNVQAMEINRHLKAEMQISQAEICNLFEEKGSLSKRFYNLKEKINALGEENRDVFSEALRLDHLYIFFKSLSAEGELKLKLLRDDICCIHAAKNSLGEVVKLQNERIRELEGETNAKKELGKEIKTLLSHISSKDREIAKVLEANRLLCRELNGLNSEVEVLRTNGEYLNSELQKKTSEVRKCEEEIRTLLNDIQISTHNAAMFEEKVLELIGACESLEILSMSRREMLGKEIASKNACVGDLKKKIDDLEGENGTLKADLNAYSSLYMSLSEGISCVEEHIFSLPKLQEKQGCSISFCLDNDTLAAPKNKESDPQLKENDRTASIEGFWELHKLITKVGTLQKVLTDTKKCLEQERLDSNANLEAARKEIEDLKLKGILPQDISKEKYGQTMKDIQLDQVSSSHASSYRENKNDKAESDDQMLGLWETSERDDIEAVEEVAGDRELSIDKLEVSTGVDESSPHECNQRVIEKLDSDAHKLLVIQKSMHKIKTKLDSLEKKKHSKSYGTFKLQLREAEKEILEQADINVRLKKKFEDNSQSFDHVVWEKEHRQILEKIGKSVSELRKMECIFFEVEEEENKRIGCGTTVRKSSILLREYLHGKRKSRFCRCMRPKTKG